uniref:Putative ATPase subunit of terminase n=1 Tax=Myoviridae sp. cte0t5 TaxID=2823549 RepID=A0A8S5LHE8_9CAUD|nr:MAG TPA: putative ATPase subunit of terminase [Myoviridae sp. cte0t5]
MRNALRVYPARPATFQGRPAVQIRDSKNEIEYFVEITEEPDSSGRYHVVNLLCRPDEGVRFPDSVPHRTLCEIAANVLERREKPARGGNQYRGLPVETLRGMVEEGKTRTDIARELDRSIYTVDAWLKRARRLDPTFPGTMTKTGKRRPARNKPPRRRTRTDV